MKNIKVLLLFLVLSTYVFGQKITHTLTAIQSGDTTLFQHEILDDSNFYPPTVNTDFGVFDSTSTVVRMWDQRREIERQLGPAGALLITADQEIKSIMRQANNKANADSTDYSNWINDRMGRRLDGEWILREIDPDATGIVINVTVDSLDIDRTSNGNQFGSFFWDSEFKLQMIINASNERVTMFTERGVFWVGNLANGNLVAMLPKQ